MIIWINGAFGSGKTQTAYALHRRLPGSFVFDPENAGYYLRNNEPLSMQRENFQDERLWRFFNLEMLKAIALDYDGVILVPMTIINSAYYAEIIGGLRNAGIAVTHFVLSANRRTLKSGCANGWREKGPGPPARLTVVLRLFPIPCSKTGLTPNSLPLHKLRSISRTFVA